MEIVDKVNNDKVKCRSFYKLKWLFSEEFSKRAKVIEVFLLIITAGFLFWQNISIRNQTDQMIKQTQEVIEQNRISVRPTMTYGFDEKNNQFIKNIGNGPAINTKFFACNFNLDTPGCYLFRTPLSIAVGEDIKYDPKNWAENQMFDSEQFKNKFSINFQKISSSSPFMMLIYYDVYSRCYVSAYIDSTATSTQKASTLTDYLFLEKCNEVK